MAYAKRKIGYDEVHWKTHDELIKADGSVEVYDWENTVVDGLGRYLGILVSGIAGYTTETYMAVGKGVVAWDTTQPEPQLTEVKLTSELARKKVTQISFLDELGAVSATPTRNVRLYVEFGEAEAIGDLREYAVFGSATATKDSGIMLNKKHHKKIPKENGDTLLRTIILKL